MRSDSLDDCVILIISGYMRSPLRIDGVKGTRAERLFLIEMRRIKTASLYTDPAGKWFYIPKDYSFSSELA